MNTGLPKWTKWLIALGFVALFAGGAFFYVQNEVEKQVRASLEDTARTNGANLTIKDVRYDLLKNVLTIEGVDLKRTLSGQAFAYTFEQIDIINPNRPLALAFVQQKLEDVRGVQPAADAIEIRNMASTSPEETKVPMQRIEGFSLNVDVLRELLAKPNRTNVDVIVTAAEAIGYKSRIVSGMTVTATENGITMQASAGSTVEKDYANLALDSVVVSDMVIKATQGSFNGSFTLKKMTMERMVLNRQIIELAISGDPESEEKAISLLKDLFLGERPFVGVLSFDDMQLTTPDINIPIKSFRYENSSTNPFAVRFDLKGLTLPVSLVLDGPVQMLAADMPTLTYNGSLSVLVPYKDPKGLTKLAAQVSIDKLGSSELDMDGLMDYSLATAENVIDSFRLTRMKMAFTDDGLMPRVAHIGQPLLSLDLSKADTQGAELLWSLVPEEQRSKESRALVDKVAQFLQKPGSIDFTFVPPHPMTAEELEEGDFGPETVQINVTPGPKTLEELVKAQSK